MLVDVADQGRYRNRKQAITTNMLGVVDWNMKFLYVLPGWEGSVSDSRVLRDAMRANRHDSFVVPKGTNSYSWHVVSLTWLLANWFIDIGKYYLVDAGYTNGEGFLAPFRSTRYHLKEWAASAQQPQTAKELYNLRHSRARNVVERTFGLFKKKWAILRSQTFFDIKDQVQKVNMLLNKINVWDDNCLLWTKISLQIRIISACCVLHNYARDRQHFMDDLLLAEVDSELANAPNDDPDDDNFIRSVQVTTEWSNFRQQLADDMFAEYLVAQGEQEIE